TSITGTQSGIFVQSTTFDVLAPSAALSGTPFSITVRAKDTNGNTLTTYNGIVHFTSSDGGAILPVDYMFVPATDNGVHTFTFGVTPFAPLSQTINATDTVFPSITGSAAVVVATQHFDFNAPGTPTAVGYTGLAPGTLYNANQGFGWVGTAAG